MNIIGKRHIFFLQPRQSIQNSAAIQSTTIYTEATDRWTGKPAASQAVLFQKNAPSMWCNTERKFSPIWTVANLSCFSKCLPCNAVCFSLTFSIAHLHLFAYKYTSFQIHALGFTFPLKYQSFSVVSNGVLSFIQAYFCPHISTSLYFLLYFESLMSIRTSCKTGEVLQ